MQALARICGKISTMALIERKMSRSMKTLTEDGPSSVDSNNGEFGKDYSRVARRITRTLFATRSLVSAAFVTTGAIRVIVAAQLSGNPAWAGVPTSVMLLGAAFAALIVAATTDRIGRRWGLTLGLAVGVLGTGLAVGSILTRCLSALPGWLGAPGSG